MAEEPSISVHVSPSNSTFSARAAPAIPNGTMEYQPNADAPSAQIGGDKAVGIRSEVNMNGDVQRINTPGLSTLNQPPSAPFPYSNNSASGFQPPALQPHANLAYPQTNTYHSLQTLSRPGYALSHEPTSTYSAATAPMTSSNIHRNGQAQTQVNTQPPAPAPPAAPALSHAQLPGAALYNSATTPDKAAATPPHRGTSVFLSASSSTLMPGAATNLPPSAIIPPVNPHGSPTRVYINQRITPYMLEGMKWVAANEPEKPLQWLGEYLLRKSKEVEGT